MTALQGREALAQARDLLNVEAGEVEVWTPYFHPSGVHLSQEKRTVGVYLLDNCAGAARR